MGAALDLDGYRWPQELFGAKKPGGHRPCACVSGGGVCEMLCTLACASPYTRCECAGVASEEFRWSEAARAAYAKTQTSFFLHSLLEAGLTAEPHILSRSLARMSRTSVSCLRIGRDASECEK